LQYRNCYFRSLFWRLFSIIVMSSSNPNRSLSFIIIIAIFPTTYFYSNNTITLSSLSTWPSITKVLLSNPVIYSEVSLSNVRIENSGLDSFLFIFIFLFLNLGLRVSTISNITITNCYTMWHIIIHLSYNIVISHGHMIICHKEHCRKSLNNNVI